MPRQEQAGLLRRCGSKFLDFADLVNRVIPLILLHLYSRSDYSAVLAHQMTSGGSDAFIHGVFVLALHVIALAASLLSPRVLLGFHLVSLTAIYSNLPWLEELRLKLAVPAGELEEGFGHPVGLNGAWDPRTKVLYKVLLQVFVGLNVMRFPNFSLLDISTWLSPIRVLTLGPLISTIGLAFSSRDYLLPCLSLALTVLTGIFLSLTSLNALEHLYFVLEADTRIYYAHLRRTCAKFEGLKIFKILNLFFILRMIEVVVQTSAEAASVSTPSTWFTLSEELLIRSCDTTVSLMSVACVSIRAVRCAMSSVRDVLRLQGAGENLKDAFFFLYFSFAVLTEVPLSNHRVGLDCLIRCLSFCIFSWMICILQTIGDQVLTLKELPRIPRERVLRIILAGCFVGITTQGAVYLYSYAGEATFTIMSATALYAEVLGKLGGYFSMLMLITMNDDGRAHFWQIAEHIQSYGSIGVHAVFCVHYFVTTCLVDPEAFLALDVRVFIIGNVESQIENTLGIQRREKAALAMELREATPEELAREDHLCAICYGEMDSAAVTDCSHIFHRDCLREWMQIRIVCPMCQRSLNRAHQA